MIKDKVEIENDTVGVVLNYVNGCTLQELLNEAPLILKKTISLDLIEQAEELTKNGIYPLDYKINNIMYSDSGEVEIIDLDDCLTKITIINNPILKRESLIKLKNTLIAIFDYEDVDKYIKPTYKGLRKYINSK